MSDDINPYQSPVAEGPTPTCRPRSLGKVRVFLTGATFGCVSFLAAIALIPGNVPSPSQHDLLLANNLGFVFPPLVGVWAGWVRRSWLWAGAGTAIGLAIGGGYYLLCGDDFLAVMVAFPCLLGGVASVAFGTGVRYWWHGILARLGKGLVAGFVLGFVYMLVLNVLGLGWFPVDSTERYHQMMWTNGPIAMSVAGGLYLVLFVWASNLKSCIMNINNAPI